MNLFALLLFYHYQYVTLGYVGHNVRNCNLGNVGLSKTIRLATLSLKDVKIVDVKMW